MTVLASDLDRTLVWSRRRLVAPGAPTPDLADPTVTADLVCVEELQGEPWAFVTRRAWAAIEVLAASDLLVPVTTRTPAQALRLRLPRFRHLLCLNGGVLLVDGEPDAEHERHTRAAVAQVTPLATVLDRLTRVGGPAGAPHVRGVREADGTFLYLLLTGDPVPPEWAAELAALAADADWTLALEQTKAYLVPRPLTKQAGVERLLARTGGSLRAAAGDSVLDEPMLRAAEHALVPQHSYLAERGWSGPFTEASGIAAGEEIARWFLALGGLDEEPAPALAGR